MDKIAIIGLACLFPGAQNPATFWQNLLAEKDSSSLATAAQMGVDPALFAHPTKGEPDTLYCLRGGYIQDFSFEPTGYNLSPAFLQGLGDDYHWALTVAQQALEDSGYRTKAALLHQTGLILGALSFPTQASHHVVAPIYTTALETAFKELFPERPFPLEPLPAKREFSPLNAQHVSSLSATVAQALGLGGREFVLDAACASSLYAVSLACEYLRAGKAEMMLAGAVSRADPFFVQMGFSIFQAYPEDDNHRPLDSNSQGLLSGEGAGIFVLKRYEDALRDNDKIYATIRGVGLSNDGRGSHLLIPNPKGQILAFERAYAEAAVKPEEIAYIECHATGTPRGDVTEVNSVGEFFGRYQAKPLLGSVKSNFGHLLTAAGMAGMIKAILSMQNGQIPATIRVLEPISSRNGAISAAQTVRATTPWPHTGATKYAAVSAFGFGGVDAHLILEQTKEWASVSQGAQTAPQAQTRLAIVGMEASFGNCAGLKAFERTIYEGKQHFIPLPEQRWKGIEKQQAVLNRFELAEPPQGAYLEELKIDFLYYKIPPIVNDQPIAQQLLLLKVVDNALRDANLAPGGNIAVLVAMENDLSLHQFRARVDLGWQIKASLAKANISLTPEELAELETLTKESVHNWPLVNQFTSFIGNVMASRVSAQWDFTGPAFTLAGEEAVFKALELAQFLLSAHKVEAVVVGAVDLAGNFENVLLQQKATPVNSGQPTLSYDVQNNGWLIGEGAGAVVLKRYSDAQQAKDQIYAVLEGLSIQKTEVVQACEAVFSATGINTSEVGYLEVTSTGIASEDEKEIAGLLKWYRDYHSNFECAIGSVKANIGQPGVAGSMASLIKTALCLYHRFLPPVPGWTGPKQPEVWESSPFYVPTEARPWLVDPEAMRRVAAVNSLQGSTFSHLLLTEDSAQRERFSTYLEHLPCALIPLAGESQTELLAQLEALEASLQPDATLANVARAQFAQYQPQATYALALVAHNLPELRREIERARPGISESFAKGEDWKTPLGSHFTAKPLGKKGSVSFVYPGAFNAYPGLGHELFHLFPFLWDRFAESVSDLRVTLAERLLYPRGLHKATPEQEKAHEERLIEDSIAMLEVGVGMAVLYTLIIQEGFKVQPKSAFGYSQGETAMMQALGVWADSDAAGKQLRSSPLYQTQLSGPKNAVRELWGLPPQKRLDEDVWGNFVLMTSPNKVREQLKNEPHVYLAIVSGPREIMIAGDPVACRRIIDKVKCHWLRAPFNHVIHSDPVRSQYDEFVNINRLPITDVKNITFYTASSYGILELTPESIAHSIAEVCCKPLDFPHLVEKVYEEGAKIFIELGPGKNCSRWIDATLQKREHIALSINKKGVADLTGIVRVLATLLSHRVDLDLSLLYRETAQKEAKMPGPKRSQPSAFNAPHPIFGAGALAQRTKFKPLYGLQPPSSPTPSAEFAPLERNLMPNAQAQIWFLQAQLKSLRQLSLLLEQQIAQKQADLNTLLAAQTEKKGSEIQLFQPHPPPPPQEIVIAPRSRASDVIWHEADLLEFAQGRIEPVFGPEYAILDSYARRVRLPIPPYLLVSRVTKLNAERGQFRPATITTEYDIPPAAWYCTDGQIPWAVAVESGQCDLLLISYIGIDFSCKGERVYRLLDCSFNFKAPLPHAGQTLRYDIAINSYAKSGESLLFFFSYDCYVDDKLVLEMRNGCAGFFTDEELSQGKGVIITEKELARRRQIEKKRFEPLLTCSKTTFTAQDLWNLTKGDLVNCFGAQYLQANCNSSLRLAPPALLMLDKIAKVEPFRGDWGLGLVIAEQNLSPEQWYFPCHFKDDQVLAGSLMAEGCCQLLQFYLLYLGLQTQTVDARFQPMPDLTQVVRCRGQVLPVQAVMTYRMEVTAVGLSPRPYVIANFDIILNGKTVVSFSDLGVYLVEKEPSTPKAKLALEPEVAQIAPLPSSKPALFNEQQLWEFTLGSIAACFGPAYEIYAQRRGPRNPNRELQLVSRVVTSDAKSGDFKPLTTLVAEYDVPSAAWYFQENAFPTMAYAIIMEIALQPCGFLATQLGSTLLFPDDDLYFRNLDGQATLFEHADLRGKTITGQARLLSHTVIQGIIIQKYDFQLTCEDQLFYKGDTSFGFFSPQTLANQVGLDGNKTVLPWTQQEPNRLAALLDLRSPAQQHWYQGRPGKPHYHLPTGRLQLLEQVLIVAEGGQYGKGYVYACGRVDPETWYFTCHFYQDPVMPGSLGVEAILQAMQAFALQTDLGRKFKSPTFGQAMNHQTIWKYRGQVAPTGKSWQLEVAIKTIEERENEVLITGDASFWRENLRIYEVKNAAVCLCEAKHALT